KGGLIMLSLCGGWLLASCTALPQQQLVVDNDGGALAFAQRSLTMDAEKATNATLEVVHNLVNARMEPVPSIGAASEFSEQAEIEVPRLLPTQKQEGELLHQNSILASEPLDQEWTVSRGELLSLTLKPKQVDLQFGKFTASGSLAEAFRSRSPLAP